MVLLLESQQSKFTLLQEGESNSEQTEKKRNTLRIPPLAESFVKEANSTAADEKTANEETVEDDESEEGNSFKDSKQEANTNTDTNNKDSVQGDSKSNETANDRTGQTNGEINENTEHSVEESKDVNLHVKQNFGAIRVGLEYSGDDVQPLEENSEGEENVTVDSESESEEDEGESEEGTGEQRDDIRAAYGKYE